jgi:hypothetical protein
MGFLMTKTQPLVSPFNSQSADFARVCLLARTIGAKTASRRRHHEKSIRGNLNPHPQAILSPIKHPIRRTCGAYNPHSRGLCAAPRFSPTRFIPPSHLDSLFRNLIASRL